MCKILHTQKKTKPVHLFDANGKSLCGEISVLGELLIDGGKNQKCSCEECSRKKTKPRKKSLSRKINFVVKKIEKKANKPTAEENIWDNVDLSANWVAMDKDGSWCGFQKKPIWIEETSQWHDKKSEWIYPIPNWKSLAKPEDSLQKRPKRSNPFRKGVRNGC